jgi:hypothetical protein
MRTVRVALDRDLPSARLTDGCQARPSGISGAASRGQSLNRREAMLAPASWNVICSTGTA